MSADEPADATAAPEPAAPVQSAPVQSAPVQPAPAQPAPAQPFAPIVREPWVNPAKRGSLLLVAVVAALLLCGGSFAIGIAVGDHGNGHRPGRYEPYGRYGGPALVRPGMMGPQHFPRMRHFGPPTGAYPAPPSPTPAQTRS